MARRPAVTKDARWMKQAVRLGHRALGSTAENPPVGCVIVKDEQVVGVGCTALGGRPHAETQALAMAAEKAEGSTVYVTLEPCCHHGKTPPCVEALIAAGVARVVVACGDPDPRVSGQGVALLRAAGVKVETGLMEREASADLAGFFSRIIKKRPYVILKLAVSADGMIAAAPGETTAITGWQARARVHLLRAQVDGIMVGLGTVQSDNPELTCRLPGLEARSPVRIIADSQGLTPRHAKVLSTAGSVPTIILTAQNIEPPPGVTAIVCQSAQTGIDLNDALHKLAGLDLNRLLVEGGAHLAQSFLEQGLVDEAQIFQSPHSLGPQGLKAPLAMLHRLNAMTEERLGPDRLSVYHSG